MTMKKNSQVSMRRGASLEGASGGSSHLQLGWGLLELMMAMTIGLFVLFGLFSLLYNMSVANKTQGQSSALQDNQRMVMSLLTEVVSHAGFATQGTNYYPGTLAGNSNSYWTLVAGQGIVGTSAGSSDTITVQYQADSSMIGCLGTVFSGTGSYPTYINQFAVVNNNLVCNFSNGGTPVSAMIASGVSSMVIYYGVDTRHLNGSADTYMRASNVASLPNIAGSFSPWSYVRSAQITVNFVNPLYSSSSTAVSVPATISVTRNIPVNNQFALGATS